MIAHFLLPPEALEHVSEQRAREVAALQKAWAELDEAHRFLTRHGVADGSLVDRLRDVLRVHFDTRDQSSLDLLDSLVTCALTAKQLCEDTGRSHATVFYALHRLHSRGLVSRERRGRVYVYRATPLGRRALRGGP